MNVRTLREWKIQIALRKKAQIDTHKWEHIETQLSCENEAADKFKQDYLLRKRCQMDNETQTLNVFMTNQSPSISTQTAGPRLNQILDYIKIQHHDAKEQDYHTHLIAEVCVFVLAETGGTEIEQCHGLNSLRQGQGLTVCLTNRRWNTSSAQTPHQGGHRCMKDVSSWPRWACVFKRQGQKSSFSLCLGTLFTRFTSKLSLWWWDAV